MKQITIVTLLIFSLVVPGCISTESGNQSIPSSDATEGISNYSGEDYPTNKPLVIDPRYSDVRSDVFIDKALIERDDFLVVMGRIWSTRLLRDIDYENSISIDLYQEGRLVKSGSVNIDTKTGNGDFIRKLNTSDLSPDQYTLAIQFPGIGEHTLQFTVEQPNYTSCGSNTCSPGESCCNGWCYNPLESVCCNGKLCYSCCDGMCFDYHNSKIPKLSCTKPKVATGGVKCGPGWCDPGMICCGGECIPAVDRVTKDGIWYNNCGKQWSVEDYLSAVVLTMK